MKPTDEEVAAMKKRLQERQAQRRFEEQDREAIRLVQSRPFAVPQALPAEAVPAAEAEEPREPVATTITLMAAWGAAELIRLLRNVTAEGWLWAAVMGMIVYLAACIA